jgi:hypothetical protein
MEQSYHSAHAVSNVNFPTSPPHVREMSFRPACGISENYDQLKESAFLHGLGWEANISYPILCPLNNTVEDGNRVIQVITRNQHHSPSKVLKGSSEKS